MVAAALTRSVWGMTLRRSVSRGGSPRLGRNRVHVVASPRLGTSHRPVMVSLPAVAVRARTMGLRCNTVQLGWNKDADGLGDAVFGLGPGPVFGAFDAVAAHLAFDDAGGGS